MSVATIFRLAFSRGYVCTFDFMSMMEETMVCATHTATVKGGVQNLLWNAFFLCIKNGTHYNEALTFGFTQIKSPVLLLSSCVKMRTLLRFSKMFSSHLQCGKKIIPASMVSLCRLNERKYKEFRTMSGEE